MVVIVSAAGEVTVVAHADLDRPFMEGLGQMGEVRRGGHVLPAHPLRRWWFQALRRVCGWVPAIVAWTRTWSGDWITDLACSAGPVLGPYATRSVAIQAEEQWLAEQLLQDPAV